MTPIVATADFTEAVTGLCEVISRYQQTELEAGAGFRPSVLRYKVANKEQNTKPSKDFIDRGYEDLDNDTYASKILAATADKIWYNDDDFSGSPRRLGSSEAVEKKARKTEIEQELLSWCKKFHIREHVDAVITALCPATLKSQILSKYSVKFDLYTNRVVPGWHQDWDDGCALIVGLVNLGRSPIKGTELLDFRSYSASLSNQAKTSVQRKAFQAWTKYDPPQTLPENQAFGQMTWFNDTVIVHRTPPYSINYRYNELYREPNKYKLADLNAAFGVQNVFYPMPDRLLTPEHKSDDRYKLNDAPEVSEPRQLLRITVREHRKHTEKLES